jgi:hypothetical protein
MGNHHLTLEEIFGHEGNSKCGYYQKAGQPKAKKKACNGRDVHCCFEFCELNADQFLESTPFTFQDDRAKGLI